MRPALLAACASALVAFAWSASANGPISGSASAYDGDGVYVLSDGKRVKIRLWGIDAPELGTPEGEASFAALKRIADGQHLRCTPPPGASGYPKSRDRLVALCERAGADIARLQVRGGFARDWPKYSRGYYAR